MEDDASTSVARFHEGELATQQRAGVRAEAQLLVGMLGPVDLGGRLGRFLEERTVVVLTARDNHGRLWLSPVVGPPGFVEVAGADVIRVRAKPKDGDPLHRLHPAQPVGMLAPEFIRRRRVRVNGTITEVGSDGFVLSVEQAYGNCPKYLQQRVLEPVPPRDGEEEGTVVRRGVALTPDHQRLIAGADTFFLGTTHPERGADASHRGGAPGFVRVLDERTLWWPDYPGNNMFNSLGNLAVDPSAALLILDLRSDNLSGRTLQLSGRAHVDWDALTQHDDGGTGRGVRFEIEAVAVRPLAVRTSDSVAASPHNPRLRDTCP